MTLDEYKTKCEQKVLGSLRYCLIENCYNTVHYEDGPTHYPCCGKHKKANKSYWEMRAERKYHESIINELINPQTP